MMSWFKKTLPLLLTLLLAFTLRFYQLELVPPTLSSDEISIAYDAHSIAQTGQDEYGNNWPLSFQSHGDYKAPLYTYLLAPLTKVLPNDEVTAKLPSVVLGVGTVLLIYCLTIQFTENYLAGILAALVLATTPWHIHTSRMVLETNVALFFLTLGVLLLTTGIRREKPLFLYLAPIGFALSMYGYHTERVLAPIILGSGLLFYFLKKHPWKTVLLSGFVFGLAITPLAFDLFLGKGAARVSGTALWHEENLALKLSNPDYLFLTKGFIFLKGFLGTYLRYANPGYLFFDGLPVLTNELFQPGLFLPLTLPFFLAGLTQLKNKLKDGVVVFWVWLLVAPAIPALTLGGNSLNRNLPAVIPYALVIALGLLFFLEKVKNHLLKIGAGVLLTLSFLGFLTTYFKHYPLQKANTYAYFGEVAQFTKKIDSKYEKIVVERRYGPYMLYTGVPHLYFGYFTELDPNKMIERQNLRFSMEFSKYEIKEINWKKEILKEKTLYVLPTSNLPSSEKQQLMKEVKTLYLPDGKPAFGIFEVK